MTRCGKAALSVGMALVAAVAVLLLLAGRWLSAAAQPPGQADLIVALGGDSGARVLTAARLYRENWAPRILVTGIEGGDARARDALLEWRARLLVAQGVPPDALLFERTAGNSREEAAAVRDLMVGQRWQRVLVVSDPPHLRRLQRIWVRTLRGSGVDFRLVASDMPEWNAARWWMHERSAQFVVTELVKIAYDMAVSRELW